MLYVLYMSQDDPVTDWVSDRVDFETTWKRQRQMRRWRQRETEIDTETSEKQIQSILSVVLWKWVWHCYITRNFRNLSLQGMLTGDSIHDSYNFYNFVILFFSPAELMAIEGWDWGWQCPRTIMKPSSHLYLVEQNLIVLRSSQSSVRTQTYSSVSWTCCVLGTRVGRPPHLEKKLSPDEKYFFTQEKVFFSNEQKYSFTRGKVFFNARCWRHMLCTK